MNACYSAIQAQYMANAVGHVVSMESAVGDQAAINFARELYSALGDGLQFRDAFEAAVAGAGLFGSSAGSLQPLLIQRNVHLLPMLEIGFSRVQGEKALQETVNRSVGKSDEERIEEAVKWLEEHETAFNVNRR